MEVGLQDRVTMTAASVRRLPAPTVPPPGGLDGVIGLLLARAAPFDTDAQAAVRRQQGWSHNPPEPIPHIRTHGRWLATPELRRLTAATAPPACLTNAVRLLEEMAPCTSGDAAAALISAGLADSPLHPGGVLALAQWYRVGRALRLQPRAGGTDVVVPVDGDLARELRRIAIAAGRAGYVQLKGADQTRRRRDHALDREGRLRREDGLVIRVDDRTSGLAGHVVRMLVHAPQPLSRDELYGGLERHWRFRQRLLPQRAVVEAWLAAQPWLGREGTMVGLVGDLEAPQLVVANSRGTAALAALVAGGAIATWVLVVVALVGTGMRPETAKMAGHTSVVLVHAGPDAYTVRGSV
jgi:hypothetical protein